MSTLKTCLLIDDDQDDQDIFMIALKNSGTGVRCSAASSATNGLDQLDKNPHALPDYIFLDLNMPGMNGKQCLLEIKSRPHLQNVPVVVYTTSFQPGDIKEARDLGAFDFITKPASVRVLTQILSDFFRKNA